MASTQLHMHVQWIGYMILIVVAILFGRGDAQVVQKTAMFGELITPGYPETYPNHLDMQWNISVPDGYQIRLYFTLFDVEYSADCEYDYLKITSGDRNIGTYCGTNEVMKEYTPIDTVLTSYPDNELSVQFHTDFSNDEQFKGFVGHYYADDIDECTNSNGGCEQRCHNYESGYFCSCRVGYKLMGDQHSCIADCRDINYTTTTGIIHTVDYPDLYPNNADCDWTVNVESGYVINFSFDFMEIEAHPTVECPYDFVMVEADGLKHGPFCGGPPDNPLPPSIVTSGHALRVLFHSDSSVNQHGFRARYYLTAKPCVDIAPPPYGSMAGTNFTFKQHVQFSCNPGYTLVGSEVRTCMADGSWSGEEARCQLVDCGEPPPLKNGHILYYNRKNFTFTNDIGFKCDKFYELIGQSIRICQADGQWSFEEPICQPKCGLATFLRRDPPRGRVVGGREVARGSWPWQTLISITATETEWDRSTHICGGSLLNEEWLLTAAHCVTGGNENHPRHFGRAVPSESLRLVLGLHEQTNEDASTVVVYSDTILIHPDYDASTYDSDIALLHLNESITFTDYIRPICLPSQNPSANMTVGDEDIRVEIDSADQSTAGVVVGWGVTESGVTSNVLKEVYVQVVDRQTCRDSTDYAVTRNMVCAGGVEGIGDSCKGDSGGALMFQNSTTLRFYAYGIVSWGNPQCGTVGTYGVYTRVENFANWVLSNSAISRRAN